MKESPDVAASWRRFCERLSAKDLEAFDELVSEEAKLIVGTAPGEEIEDRAGMRYGFETEGVRLESDRPRAWEEGSVGWVFDRPRFVFPDDSSIQTRVSAVLRREGERWKLVHAHFSVGVPDEEVGELQQRWAAAGAGQQEERPR